MLFRVSCASNSQKDGTRSWQNLRGRNCDPRIVAVAMEDMFVSVI